MQTGWRKHLITASLLLAALSVYVDAPRLHLATSLGDTLNALRVLDPMQHTFMQLRLDAMAQLADSESAKADLAEQLNDGRESLDLLAHTSLLQAILPAPIVLQAPALLMQDHVPAFAAVHSLPGRVLTLDLPPPRFEALFKPPAMQAQSLFSNLRNARAPPLARWF